MVSRLELGNPDSSCGFTKSLVQGCQRQTLSHGQVQIRGVVGGQPLPPGKFQHFLSRSLMPEGIDTDREGDEQLENARTKRFKDAAPR